LAFHDAAPLLNTVNINGAAGAVNDFIEKGKFFRNHAADRCILLNKVNLRIAVDCSSRQIACHAIAGGSNAIRGYLIAAQRSADQGWSPQAKIKADGVGPSKEVYRADLGNLRKPWADHMSGHGY
jgi:hypothetical protein